MSNTEEIDLDLSEKYKKLAGELTSFVHELHGEYGTIDKMPSYEGTNNDSCVISRENAHLIYNNLYHISEIDLDKLF